MRRINLTIDEDTFNLLEGTDNKSQKVRDALAIQNLCVSPDRVKSLGLIIRSLAIDYKNIKKQLKEIDSKLDYLARQIDSREVG